MCETNHWKLGLVVFVFVVATLIYVVSEEMYIFEKLKLKYPEKSVPQAVAKFQMHQDLCLTVPAIIVALTLSNQILGSLRIVVILCLLTRTFCAFCAVLVARGTLPIESLIPLNSLRGTLGTSLQLFASVFTHVSQQSNALSRSLNLGLIESAILMGSGFGFLAAGLVTSFLNPAKSPIPFGIVLALYAADGLIAVSVLKNDQSQFEECDDGIVQMVESSYFFGFLRKKIRGLMDVVVQHHHQHQHQRSDFRRLLLFITIAARTFLKSGQASIIYLFLKRNPANFSQFEYGAFRSSRCLFSSIGILFASHWLRKNGYDELQFGIIANIVANALFVTASFVRSAAFWIPITGILSDLPGVSVRNRLACMYATAKHRSLFSFLAIVDMLSVLLGTLVFTRLYALLPDKFVWILFVLSSAIEAILYYSWTNNNRLNDQPIMTNQNYQEQSKDNDGHRDVTRFATSTDPVVF